MYMFYYFFEGILLNLIILTKLVITTDTYSSKKLLKLGLLTTSRALYYEQEKLENIYKSNFNCKSLI
jgi:hypothetical protein